MTNRTLDSVAHARRIAERRLPRPVSIMVRGGTELGRTAADNLAAFDEVELLPRIADLPADRAHSVEVLSRTLGSPVILAPTGAHCIHPDGEVAAARAAASRGTAIVLSAFGTKPVEDVVAANPNTFAQIYWLGRDTVEMMIDRAKHAGVVGLVVTLDWSFTYWKDWDAPRIPARIGPAEAFRFAPDVARRPRWLIRYLRRRHLPSLATPNVVPIGDRVPRYREIYQVWADTPPPTWSDIGWMRTLWDGPFLIKGVMRADDAKRAVDIGATAISVSNHGGNNLDSTPASLRALPPIARAVGRDIEVLLDGGIRRGSDVVKARALGAKAVLIGRPYLWGLAANGEAGVADVLDIFADGIDGTLRGLGKDGLSALTPSDVLVPPGFERDAVTSSTTTQPTRTKAPFRGVRIP